MRLITLTTDYGSKDAYCGAFKLALLQHIPQVQLVDISHEVEPFNVIDAAYKLATAYKYIPTESVNIIHVDVQGGNSNILIVVHQEKYFVMPDNGLIGILFPQERNLIVYKKEISAHHLIGFNIHAVYGEITQHIFSKKIDEVYKRTTQYILSVGINPVVTNNTINATVVYVDRYGNSILNVSKKLFQEIGNGKRAEIVFRRNSVSTISTNYSDVPENEICCLFNDMGLLEIAINKGAAVDLLGLQIGANVLIDFI